MFPSTQSHLRKILCIPWVQPGQPAQQKCYYIHLYMYTFISNFWFDFTKRVEDSHFYVPGQESTRKHLACVRMRQSHWRQFQRIWRSYENFSLDLCQSLDGIVLPHSGWSQQWSQRRLCKVLQEMPLFLSAPKPMQTTFQRIFRGIRRKSYYRGPVILF